MSETSRRKLLAGGSRGGRGHGRPDHGTRAGGEARRSTSSAQESVVAYVEDHRSGSCG